MSPFDMLRDFLAPKPRKQLKSEKPKAKDGGKEAVKAGTGSIFDITQAQAAKEGLEGEAAAAVEQMKVGRVADHVSCLRRCLEDSHVLTVCVSVLFV